MKNLCTICMRGGSKGVPSKNLRDLCGKPLMAYTIEQALESELFEHVVVSTDSEKIAETARHFGAEAWFLRPAEMATDEAPKLPVIRHAFLEAEKHYGHQFDVIVDLDATSPLRNSQDIKLAYQQFINVNADMLVSVTLAKKNPYFNMLELAQDKKVKLVKELDDWPVRRQDAPKAYNINASIYIWKRNYFTAKNKSLPLMLSGKTELYIMPEERSIDIDCELDFLIVEALMKNRDKWLLNYR